MEYMWTEQSRTTGAQQVTLRDKEAVNFGATASSFYKKDNTWTWQERALPPRSRGDVVEYDPCEYMYKQEEAREARKGERSE